MDARHCSRLLYCRFIYLILILLLTSQSLGLGIATTRSEANVTEKYCILTVSPSFINVSIPAGWTYEEDIHVGASPPGNTGLDIALSRIGEIGNWMYLEANYLNLSSCKSENLTVSIDIPGNASLGVHNGSIWLVSGDGQEGFVNITVNVSEGTGRVNITVRDTINNPVQGATVFLWKDAYLKDSGSTNENGTWISKWVYTGNYTLEVSKSGYGLYSKIVEIPAGKTAQVNITLAPSAGPVLDVSPRSISEYAYVEENVTRTLTVINIGDMLLDNITL